MALSKIPLTSEEWTLIGDNVSSVSFQNSSQNAIYINFTSNNTAPTDTVGWMYGPREGTMKKNLTDMTSLASPTHVWAKSASYQGSVIVEE